MKHFFALAMEVAIWILLESMSPGRGLTLLSTGLFAIAVIPVLLVAPSAAMGFVRARACRNSARQLESVVDRIDAARKLGGAARHAANVGIEVELLHARLGLPPGAERQLRMSLGAMS